MNNIEFYSKPDCFYCEKAKWHIRTFLSDYTIHEEIINDETKAYIQDMYNVEVKTVPQIIIGGVYVGGCDGLIEYIDNL